MPSLSKTQPVPDLDDSIAQYLGANGFYTSLFAIWFLTGVVALLTSSRKPHTRLLEEMLPQDVLGQR